MRDVSRALLPEEEKALDWRGVSVDRQGRVTLRLDGRTATARTVGQALDAINNKKRF